MKTPQETEEFNVGYYYRHTNGTINFKPKLVVEMGGGAFEYFNSPFVEKWILADKQQQLKELSE